MKWSSALHDYSLYLKIERGLSEQTIINYGFDVQKLIAFLEIHSYSLSPIDIESNTIQQFIYEVAKTLNSRSQSRIISGLRSFFDFLVFEDYRKTNPLDLIEAPKIGRKLPDTLSIKEIDQIIDSVDLSRPQGERNRAILETLYCCGLRGSELINLKLSDLFFQEFFIKITGKGNKQRFVPIGKSTINYINTYIQTHRAALSVDPAFLDTVFLNRRGKQLTRAMIFTIVRQHVEKAGIQKTISPHTFRHSFATHMLENGADLRAIQLMLGHESITTTEIYMHIDKRHLQKVMTNYHPRA